MLFFMSPLGCCIQRSEFNNTRVSTSLSYSVRVRDSSPPLCKNHKKPEVAKKTQACETITLTKSFAFSWCRCSKQSVSCLLTMIWSEHFIRWGFFQICSGNNNTSLLLYACELSYLISKGMIFPYVQE